MKVAVSGAAGFVGLNLVDALAARGHTVVAIDRAFPAAVRRLLPETATCVEADIRDRDALGEAFAASEPDALFAFAAVTADTAREMRSFAEVLDINVTGTARTLEAAHRAGVSRIFVASSSAVYGEAVYQGPPDEDDRTEPSSLYGISKLAAETAALRFGHIHGLDVTALRIAAVFGRWERRTGARDRMSPLYQIAESAQRREPVSLPRGGARDWIDVRRIASIACAMLECERLERRVYNLAARSVWPPELFCRHLRDAMPGFDWSMDAALPTIDYNDDLACTRFPLSTSRLRAELGDDIIGDPDTDAASFARWVDQNPEWFLTPT